MSVSKSLRSEGHGGAVGVSGHFAGPIFVRSPFWKPKSVLESEQKSARAVRSIRRERDQEERRSSPHSKDSKGSMPGSMGSKTLQLRVGHLSSPALSLSSIDDALNTSVSRRRIWSQCPQPLLFCVLPDLPEDAQQCKTDQICTLLSLTLPLHMACSQSLWTGPLHSSEKQCSSPSLETKLL